MSRVKGFTILEALVAAALLATGVTGVMAAVGAMSRNQVAVQDRMLLHRLADAKFQELAATAQINSNPSGDLTEEGYPGIRFSTDLAPTDTQNLQELTLTLDAPELSVTTLERRGLVFIPPAPPTGATP